MEQIDNQKEVAKVMSFMDSSAEDGEVASSFLDRHLTVNEIDSLESTLKAEIIFARNSFGNGEALTTTQIWKNNMYSCQDIFSDSVSLEGLAEDLIYISADITEESYAFIYDTVSDVCFKVEQTDIGGVIVHSLEYAKFILDGEGSTGVGVVTTDVGVIEATDGTLSYEPDLNNFSYKTEIVFYSEDMKSTETMDIQEFISEGKPSTMIVGEETYTFANYVSDDSEDTQVWANIKCTSNGLESYWVWIPRFAYKLDDSTTKAEYSDIIFVDTDDNPLDGSELPSDYVVHEAFNQDGALKGIWFSKYQPTAVETSDIDSTDPATPDLSNFSSENTKLIYYTADAKSSIEVDYSEEPEQTIEQDGETYYFYDYENQIWANVKCTGGEDELESYWVWIPRFAYKLESGQSSVILIDENNVPIDKTTYGNTLPSGYTVHEAFSQDDGLEGIWFSKYQPTATETADVDTSEMETPDLSNFSASYTKLIYYTLDLKSSIEVDYTENPDRIITQDGVNYYFYSYLGKIWPNVKCSANGYVSYWVWIPRYAYKLEKGTIKVVLLDENDTPLDTTTFGTSLPDGYVLHEAFTQGDGLKGIWFSKYQPTETEVEE